MPSRVLTRDPRGFEGSVEADPRVTTPAHLDLLRRHGFTRLSLGVQDFADEVQQLVNRIQPFDITARLITHARASGYDSVNCDLIYGLPGQTVASMRQTAEAILSLRPDRLAVYSFARVPWIKPQQRKFRDDQIPVGAEKRALYETIRGPLLDAGYVELGLDHFALPHDGLARAAEGESMHRNFQGYTERRDFDRARSASASARSRKPPTATTRTRRSSPSTIGASPKTGPSRHFEGIVLSDDDQDAAAHVEILAIMTEASACGSTIRHEVADARQFLAPLIADGLCELDRPVTNCGCRPQAMRPFLRNVTAFFDAHLRASQPSGPKYSTAV